MGSVFNIAIGGMLIFAVLAFAGSLLTRNFDGMEILGDAAPLIIITLGIYALVMGYVVYLYDGHDWFEKNYVLNIIRFAFTPLVCLIGYFFA